MRAHSEISCVVHCKSDDTLKRVALYAFLWRHGKCCIAAFLLSCEWRNLYGTVPIHLLLLSLQLRQPLVLLLLVRCQASSGNLGLHASFPHLRKPASMSAKLSLRNLPSRPAPYAVCQAKAKRLELQLAPLVSSSSSVPSVPASAGRPREYDPWWLALLCNDILQYQCWSVLQACQGW